MKAWVRDRYGSPDVLRLDELPDTPPKGDEVRVLVRAASLNRADLDYLYGVPAVTRLGTGVRRPRNRRLGLDVAGVVEAVGAEVQGLRPGDEVFGDLTAFGYGAFADVVTAPERAFALKPARLSLEEAATVPQSGVLALQGLKAWRPLRAGESVLVNGASGNVGPFAVQIAKAMGAEVTGACSSGKMEMVRQLGADHVIDYRAEDAFSGARRYDRIVDVASHRSLLAIRRTLRPGGVFAWIGGSMGSLLGILTLGSLMSVTGSRKMSLFRWKPFEREDVAVLTELVEDGLIRPVIDRRMPLEEVPAALRLLESGTARGKIVISV